MLPDALHHIIQPFSPIQSEGMVVKRLYLIHRKHFHAARCRVLNLRRRIPGQHVHGVKYLSLSLHTRSPPPPASHKPCKHCCLMYIPEAAHCSKHSHLPLRYCKGEQIYLGRVLDKEKGIFKTVNETFLLMISIRIRLVRFPRIIWNLKSHIKQNIRNAPPL